MNPSDRRAVDIPDAIDARFRRSFGRALRGRCPYCGSHGIFAGPMTLKDRCPGCATLYAYEDGYFLGSYAINVVFMVVFGIALVIALIAATDLSVLQMQVLGVAIVIVLPIVLYPLTLLLWIAIDITLHPPGAGSGSPRS